MPSLTIRLTEHQLSEIRRLSEINHLTVTDFILKNTIPHTLSNNLMLDMIINRVMSLNSGELFSVKALFSYSEWHAFSKNSRISSCRNFYKCVQENKYNLGNNIEFVNKDSSNLAIYKRK
ncbi:DUF1413 domain-containing protein [Paraclostridium bifermentans]|uniref:DUF1413 domain-containing protein n=1 Tax=Paraclostridium bifermentans TaxID=1490 RepID=UPI002149B459|nr:DUF1413 domain-containing protein [Paraclostridium bifermentans]MCR1877332.1 DUF1413 domain-containing protein [Paraclostridium bifermentans]